MTIMLNNAKNAFEDAWPFPWLEQTITGPAPLSIPDLKYVRMVKHVASNCELLGLDYRQVAQDGTDLSLPGFPQYWWVEGPDPVSILHTWPVNTDSVSAAYTARVAGAFRPARHAADPRRATTRCGSTSR